VHADGIYVVHSMPSERNYKELEIDARKSELNAGRYWQATLFSYCCTPGAV
jgi:hypothetical protein